MVHWICLGILLGADARPIGAQAVVSRTPAEFIADINLYRTALSDAVPPATAVYPRDSLRASAMARARQWLDSVAPFTALQVHEGNSNRISSLQLESLVQLAAIPARAREDSLA